MILSRRKSRNLVSNNNQGRYITKPLWWFALITESDLHERIRRIAEKRAKEMGCFGGR